MNIVPIIKFSYTSNELNIFFYWYSTVIKKSDDSLYKENKHNVGFLKWKSKTEHPGFQVHNISWLCALHVYFSAGFVGVHLCMQDQIFIPLSLFDLNIAYIYNMKFQWKNNT